MLSPHGAIVAAEGKKREAQTSSAGVTILTCKYFDFTFKHNDNGQILRSRLLVVTKSYCMFPTICAAVNPRCPGNLFQLIAVVTIHCPEAT